MDARHEIGAKFSNQTGGEIVVSEVRFDPPLESVYALRRADGGTLTGFAVGAQDIDIKIIFLPREETTYNTTMEVLFENSAVTLPIDGAGRVLVPPTLELAPVRVDFFEAELGRDVVRTIELRNSGDLPANVERVSSKTGRAMGPTDEFYLAEHATTKLASSFVLEPTESRTLDVHFRPVQPVGPKDDKLALDIDGADPVEIPVIGTAVLSGELTCSPSPLDVGTVLRGDTKDERIECASHGGVFTLASIDMAMGSSDLFSLPLKPSPGVSLRDGESMSFAVRLEGSGRAVRHGGTVEIKAAHGAIDLIEVFGTIAAPLASDTRLMVQLNWNTLNTDLDLHVVRRGSLPFDGFDDCYYGKAHQNWGSPTDETDDAYLDADDRVGGGPERVNLAVAPEGRYDVFVHYYEGVPATSASISVYERGEQKFTDQKTLTSCGDLWHVATLNVGPASIGATRVGVSAVELGRAKCQ
ncbi:MAG: hypothetical protein HY791_18105 [Deltaproteobacteria bacterium]|nr:hypothetical protein [Deltaproteobacteria bacterium]